MDFIFSKRQGDAAAIRRLLAALPSASDPDLDGFGGEWGVMVTTPSPYLGLDATQVGQVICAVQGDPLCSGLGPDPQATDRSRRTRAYIAQYNSPKGIADPYHPGSVVVIDTAKDQIEVTTDATGMAGVFLYQEGDDLLLSSSPDLIAALRPCSLDRLSVLQLLSSQSVSFPYTCYRQVKELQNGARTVFLGGKLAVLPWWRPQLANAKIDLAAAISAIEAALLDFFARMAAEQGRDGFLTLSAGLDSRYLAALATQSDSLDLKTVTIASGQTYSAWVSEKVAATLNLPHRTVQRPSDHYARLFLTGAPEIPSNSLLSDGHFHGKSLGDGIGPFLLGGWRADTILGREDYIWRKRADLMAKSRLPPETPFWIADPMFQQFGAEAIAALDARQAEAVQALGLDPMHYRGNGRLLMLNRSQSKGHNETSRRAYPMYEAFLSRAMTDLMFALPFDQLTPENLPIPERKHLFYSHRLAGTAKIPANPVQSDSYRQMVRAIKKELPPELWPTQIIDGGEWSEVPAGLQAELADAHRAALHQVQEVMELQLDYQNTKSQAALYVGLQRVFERCAQL